MIHFAGTKIRTLKIEFTEVRFWELDALRQYYKADSTTLTLNISDVGSLSFNDILSSATLEEEDGSFVEYVFDANKFAFCNIGVSKLSVPVPEPSAFGLLAGLGALALVASRRRRK